MTVCSDVFVQGAAAYWNSGISCVFYVGEV